MSKARHGMFVIVSLNQDWDPAPGTHVAQGTLVVLDLAELMADIDHLKPVTIYVPGPRETFESALET